MNYEKEMKNVIREFYGSKMRVKIGIWGAGRFGRYVYDKLKNRKDIEIKIFLDRNAELTDKK